MYDLLEDVERKGLDDIVSWLPDGKSFKIRIDDLNHVLADASHRAAEAESLVAGVATATERVQARVAAAGAVAGAVGRAVETP